MADRDLQKLLELAEDIIRHEGYLGEREAQELERNNRSFAKVRRAVVHQIAKREGTLGLHQMHLDRDLRVAAAAIGAPDASLDYTKHELFHQLIREHERGLVARLFVRWGPSTLALLVALVSFVIHFWPELEWLIS